MQLHFHCKSRLLCRFSLHCGSSVFFLYSFLSREPFSLWSFCVHVRVTIEFLEYLKERLLRSNLRQAFSCTVELQLYIPLRHVFSQTHVCCIRV